MSGFEWEINQIRTDLLNKGGVHDSMTMSYGSLNETIKSDGKNIQTYQSHRDKMFKTSMPSKRNGSIKSEAQYMLKSNNRLAKYAKRHTILLDSCT